MSEGRLFGTDGIRGRYGEGWLTPERVSALGRAIGEELRDRAGDEPRALLGNDGRGSGPVLEHALARGLAAAGYTATSAGLITTPGLALLGRRREFDVTIMVSASHNPAHDNGIKVFLPNGEKLDDALEDRIEARVRAAHAPITDGPPPAVDESLRDEYAELLLEAAGELRLDGLSIVVDCANGGGSLVAPRVLARLGAEVHAIANEPDGSNINAGCGATQLRLLQDAVRTSGARVGVALDGDGDRCILVDEHGEVVDGDPILMMCALHAARHDRLPSKRIVATVMSNRGLHRALRDAGVGVETVGVGDRRVVEGLRREGLGLGGEQSGHVVFGSDLHFIGDGTYTALRALEVLCATGRSLSELAAPYRPMPQVLINVDVSSKPDLATLGDVQALVDEVEGQLGDDGRVLLRYSGTEPKARVMVEGPDRAWIDERAGAIAALLRDAIGAD